MKNLSAVLGLMAIVLLLIINTNVASAATGESGTEEVVTPLLNLDPNDAVSSDISKKDILVA